MPMPIFEDNKCLTVDCLLDYKYTIDRQFLRYYFIPMPASFKKKSSRALGSQISRLESQAQEFQDKADRHHTSVYIIFIMCTIAIDLSDWLGFGTLTILLSPMVWMINIFLWFSQRDLWEVDDYATSFITCIMESLPIIDELPSATANAIQKWIKSALVSRDNQKKADDYNAQAQALRAKQRRESLNANRATTFEEEEPQKETEQDIDSLLQGSQN